MTISDIKNKIYFLTNTSSSNFSDTDILIEINNAYERAASLIMESDGRWKWDDSNHSDLPIATTTLVDAQQDYTFATTHLSIDRVSVKDSNGNYQLLKSIDQLDVSVDLDEYKETDGMPTYYDKSGASVFLYPAPASGSVTLSEGLKIQFSRAPDLFTSTDLSTGTKVPGFNSLYHDLIPYWVAFNFAIAKGLPNANQLMAEIDRKERQIKLDYAFRSKDEPNRMTAKVIDMR